MLEYCSIVACIPVNSLTTAMVDLELGMGNLLTLTVPFEAFRILYPRFAVQLSFALFDTSDYFHDDFS